MFEHVPLPRAQAIPKTNLTRPPSLSGRFNQAGPHTQCMCRFKDMPAIVDLPFFPYSETALGWCSQSGLPLYQSWTPPTLPQMTLQGIFFRTFLPHLTYDTTYAPRSFSVPLPPPPFCGRSTPPLRNSQDFVCKSPLTFPQNPHHFPNPPVIATTRPVPFQFNCACIFFSSRAIFPRLIYSTRRPFSYVWSNPAMISTSTT